MRLIKQEISRLIVFLVFFVVCFNFLALSECIGAKRINTNGDVLASNLDFQQGDSTSFSTNGKEELKTQSGSTVPELEKKEDQNKNKDKLKPDEGPKKVINRLFIWMLGDNTIVEFKTHMIAFGKNNLPLFLQKFYFQLIEKTYTYPIIILFIVFIFLLGLNISTVLLIMYFTNSAKSYRERYTSIYRNSYEEVLRSYLFGEIDWERTLQKLKRLSNPLNRKILTSVLLNFKENLRGEMDTYIPEIFFRLGLQKDALKLTNSVFYFRRIEGMKALTNLDPESAKEIIPNYLNDSNFLVRTESQVSYVRLYHENPFGFLNSLTSPFPRWTQLSAFYIFRLHQVPVPAFVDYIHSSNSDVRNFCLRMITFFQQLENASEVFVMLESTVENTRFLAIRAINDLRLYDGKKLLKDIYLAETEKNKIEIVKALKNIGADDDFEFLESIIQSDSVSLTIEACRSLYYVNTRGQERLRLLNQNSNLKFDQFLNHVTDPRN